jgi:hypothetical protein
VGSTEIIVLALNAIVPIIAIVVLVSRANARQTLSRTALLEAAAILQLPEVAKAEERGAVLSGERSGFAVKIATFERSRPGQRRAIFTQIVVKTDLPEGLRIAKASIAALAEDAPTDVEDVMTGDGEFDAEMLVRSRSLLDAVARLSYQAREAARLAIGAYDAKLERGEIRFERSECMSDAHEIAGITDGMIALARALQDRTRTLKEQIIFNATEDPVGGVRVHNLRLLFASRYGDSKEVQRLAEAALHDRDPQVRIVAAHALGDAGFETLRRMAFNVRIPPPARVEAFEAMAAGLSANPDVLTLIDEAIAGTEEPVLSAMLRTCNRADHVPALALLRVRSAFTEAEGKLELIRLLAKSVEPKAEELIFDLLHSEDDAIASEAAKTLGLIGTRASLTALQDGNRRLGLAREVRAAIKDAIARIQTRLMGHGGRLSVSPLPTGGELSVSVRPPGGEVSLEDPLEAGSRAALSRVPEDDQ